MKILITGAEGFIGRNLVVALRARGFHDLLKYDADTPVEFLEHYCEDCEFVFHLAGVNRPQKQEEFMQGNFGFTDTLLRMLIRHKNQCPVMFASSTQAALPNLYGRSKKAGEELLDQYARETGAKVYIFRFPNVFGKWSKPNYNSAIATFCYNVSHDLPITVNDESTVLNLAYIDDVAEALCDLIEDKAVMEGPYCVVPVVHTATLGEIAGCIRSFRTIRETNTLPDMSDPLTRKLYATYLSFLPMMEFSYPLQMHEDERGSFTEFLRSASGGQVSVNVSRPGVAKGNHWHHTKAEKFLVVSGSGVIKFRRIDMDEVIEYPVSAKNLSVVDIPVGYTHSIENTGKTDMVTLMWSSECFDPEHPDTIAEEVDKTI